MQTYREASDVPDKKRELVVALFRIGTPTVRIAKKVELSTARVTQIVKEDIKLRFKRAGSEETRLDMFAELEVVKQPLLDKALGDGSGDAPDKDTVRSLLAITRQQAMLVGGSAPAPLMGGNDLPTWVKERRAVEAYQKRQRAVGDD